MVHEQIVARGVRDQRVVEAIRRVPRHRFVSRDVELKDAYADSAIDIGFAQTTSHPFFVAAIEPFVSDPPAVLEIGTGLATRLPSSPFWLKKRSALMCPLIPTVGR